MEGGAIATVLKSRVLPSGEQRAVATRQLDYVYRDGVTGVCCRVCWSSLKFY